MEYCRPWRVKQETSSSISPSTVRELVGGGGTKEKNATMSPQYSIGGNTLGGRRTGVRERPATQACARILLVDSVGHNTLMGVYESI